MGSILQTILSFLCSSKSLYPWNLFNICSMICQSARSSTKRRSWRKGTKTTYCVQSTWHTKNGLYISMIRDKFNSIRTYREPTKSKVNGVQQTKKALTEWMPTYQGYHIKELICTNMPNRHDPQQSIQVYWWNKVQHELPVWGKTHVFLYKNSVFI